MLFVVAYPKRPCDINRVACRGSGKMEPRQKRGFHTAARRGGFKGGIVVPQPPSVLRALTRPRPDYQRSK